MPIFMLLAILSINQAVMSSSLSQLKIGLSASSPGNLTSGLIWTIGLSLYFLSPHRDARWLGMVLLGFPAVYRILINFGALSILTPLIWSFILSLILLVWGLDWRTRRIHSRLLV
jgi:hypothetical protein